MLFDTAAPGFQFILKFLMELTGCLVGGCNIKWINKKTTCCLFFQVLNLIVNASILDPDYKSHGLDPTWAGIT